MKTVLTRQIADHTYIGYGVHSDTEFHALHQIVEEKKASQLSKASVDATNNRVDDNLNALSLDGKIYSVHLVQRV